jgi:hypothetical protein
MSCACLQNLIAMLTAFPPVTLPAIDVPPCIAQLTAAMGGPSALAAMDVRSSAAAAASAAASMDMALGMDASAVAQLSAVASAMTQVQANLGINLAAPGASAQLSAMVSLMNSWALAAFLYPVSRACRR